MRAQWISIGVAAVAFCALALVASASGQGATSSSGKPHAGSHVASGEITAYDDKAHSLTLKTSKGSTTFGVAEDAKVYVASKSVGPEEVLKQLGTNASVTYTSKNGQRTASSIRITPAKAPTKS